MGLTNTQLIIKFLEDRSPDKACDDCISKETGVSPRQQVNQICRSLDSQEVLVRHRASCSVCHTVKLVNHYFSSQHGSGADTDSCRTQPSSSISNMTEIVYVCNEIENMCTRLWQKSRPDIPPKFGTPLINQMKNEQILPAHQANMMLTLCNLRNAVVHKKLELGANESEVASAAWVIVTEWWKQQGVKKT